MFLQFITINTNQDNFNNKDQVKAAYEQYPAMKVFVDLLEAGKANGLVLESDIIVDANIATNIHTIRRTYPSYDAYLEYVATISNEVSDNLINLFREKGWTVTYTLNEVSDEGNVVRLGE